MAQDRSFAELAQRTSRSLGRTIANLEVTDSRMTRTTMSIAGEDAVVASHQLKSSWPADSGLDRQS